MKFVAVCIFLVSSGMLFAQKAFTGKLVYRVEIADTSLQNMFPPSTMTIYTNDTILRVETRTDALGAQVLIQHMEKKKAYLLIESPMGKYAIQIPEKEEEVEKRLIEKLCYFLLLTGTSTCSVGSSNMATPQLTQRYVCVGQSREKASLRANLVRTASLEKIYLVPCY